MKAAAVTGFIVVMAGTIASAHRLDEYLQATRVAIARSELSLEIDLTPGASIASAIVVTIDSDADAAISLSEADAYARAVLADVMVKLDGTPVPLALTRIEVPPVAEMRDGLGTIRMHASGIMEAGAGRHQLSFLNNHRPDTSVYLVNALVPEDKQVSLGAAIRDPRQREFRTEFTVMPERSLYLLWLGLVMTGLAVMAVRSKEKRKRKTE